MTYVHEFRLADDSDAGMFTTSECRWQVGDEFIGQSNSHWRIRAIVPRERMAEFVDGAEVELWEVAPILLERAAG